MLPEKCAFGTNIDVICAHEKIKIPTGFPDNWYQGTVNFKDSLWRISAEDSSATLLINTESASGRQLDVTDMTLGTNDTNAYFINKNDNTLWTYEL